MIVFLLSKLVKEGVLISKGTVFPHSNALATIYHLVYLFNKVPLKLTPQGLRYGRKSKDNNFNAKEKPNRAIRKGYIDKEKEREGGDSYVSGNFEFIFLNLCFPAIVFFSLFEVLKSNISSSIKAFDLKF